MARLGSDRIIEKPLKRHNVFENYAARPENPGDSSTSLSSNPSMVSIESGASSRSGAHQEHVCRTQGTVRAVQSPTESYLMMECVEEVRCSTLSRRTIHSESQHDVNTSRIGIIHVTGKGSRLA